MKKLIFLSIVVLLMIAGLVWYYISEDSAMTEFLERNGPIENHISLPDVNMSENYLGVEK